MKKYIVFAIFFTVLQFILEVPLFSDNRTENIDVFVVLDKSLSMEEEIDAVKSYVSESIIDDILIPGDFFALIAFYGQAEDLILKEMTDDGVRENFKDTVNTIKANGRFTDIGNALDTLNSELSRYQHETRRKYLLLITDGKQEAPPESKYFTPDGNFNHAFLENARTIQKKGWKIQILGLGTAAEAKAIAQELSGDYSEVADNVTFETLTESASGFLGRLEVVGTPVISPVPKSGKTTLSLMVASTNFSEIKSSTISSVQFTSDGFTTGNILVEPFTFSVDPEGEADIKLSLLFPKDLDKGVYEGSLIFRFQGDTTFLPTLFTLKVIVKGFWRNHLYFIPILALLAAIIAFLAVNLSKRPPKPHALKVKFYVDNTPFRNEPFTITTEKPLYIKSVKGSYVIDGLKPEHPLALLRPKGTDLVLEVLSPDEFPLMDTLPEGTINGKKFRVKSRIGNYKTLLFRII